VPVAQPGSLDSVASSILPAVVAVIPGIDDLVSVLGVGTAAS